MEYTAKELLAEVNSAYVANGDERLRAITEDMVTFMYELVQKHNITHDEVWDFTKWANQVGAENHVLLYLTGFGLERLLDIMADNQAKKEGKGAATPRAIEGPLFVPGAPVIEGFGRMDDGKEPNAEDYVVEGRVTDPQGNPIAGVKIDIWHANQNGAYSIMDPTQTPYNHRRTIVTREDGTYGYKTKLPPGYAVPEGCATDKAFKAIGRDTHRPAHVHYMIEADGYDKLTTQFNIPGDKYLHADFAFATRDDLIVDVKKVNDPELIKKFELDGPFSYTKFDLVLEKN